MIQFSHWVLTILGALIFGYLVKLINERCLPALESRE